MDSYIEKKFAALRIIGTIWKTLAWIWLVVGVLSSIGLLVASIRTGLMNWLAPQAQIPGLPSTSNLVGGMIGFAVSLTVVFFYFLALYAVGDLTYLLLAIEENSRETTLWLRSWGTRPQAAQAQPAPPEPPPPEA